MLRDDYTRILEESNVSTLRARALMTGSRSFAQAPSFAAEDFADDTRWLLARLESAGFDRVVVVDLTSPSFNLPVVRVVIPGLGLPFDSDRSRRLPEAHS
jgi:ribosomal protein S12 methylthiotransferase accessory factor